MEKTAHETHELHKARDASCQIFAAFACLVGNQVSIPYIRVIRVIRGSVIYRSSALPCL
jgi:hypothetical protein